LQRWRVLQPSLLHASPARSSKPRTTDADHQSRSRRSGSYLPAQAAAVPIGSNQLALRRCGAAAR
jgi:hypothetical protein